MTTTTIAATMMAVMDEGKNNDNRQHCHPRRQCRRHHLRRRKKISIVIHSCTRHKILMMVLGMIMISTLSTPSPLSSLPSFNVMVVSAFEFQHDDDPDTCQKLVKQCTKDTSTWYKCPISCSDHYQREGSMAEERNDPEQFFHLNILLSNGNNYSLDNNEGYITLFAVVPLLRGVSQYYYDIIEHISHVYKYTLVSIVYPYRTNQATMAFISQQQSNNNNPKHSPPKTKLLMSGPSSSSTSSTLTTSNINDDTLQYLLTRTVVAGNNQDTEIALDRPTIFLVSHDGMYIERLIAPTMETIERRIKVYEMTMNIEPKDL